MICPSCGNDWESVGQHISLSQCEWPEIENDDLDIIVGALLGDGTIMDSPWNCQYSIGSINRDYLVFLQEELSNWLTNSIFLDSSCHNYDNHSEYYKLTLRKHSIFNEMRKKWYKNGKKSFPDDLYINSTRLTHWYVTDGSLERRRGNARPRAKICNTLEEDDPSTIINLFEDIGIECRYHQYGTFRMNPDATEELFDYMGEPLPGFGYKWPERFK